MGVRERVIVTLYGGLSRGNATHEMIYFRL